MRRAVAGANCRCYMATTPGRPAPAAQVEGLSAELVGWRRMMSSAAEPTSSPPSSVKNSESPEEKAEKGGVVVSSNWGISRPKITREISKEIWKEI
ncbi:hypothetical protein SASPL_153422 [Salvia splendens]|uniref:Uncharacterized protein n=1 Tax=Salvia splendens TaxID=180675 RepID=A0A8X8W4Z7_SALSN|nr:hypothetical protein SASPL_153422 [Salvia splendens]